uniref:Uncharacterized protein n=1 Tax=Anguilla anguilla TaxID=7936 RepID=A0A0E9W1W9_ANGAN
MKSVLASLIKLNHFHICVYLKYHCLYCRERWNILYAMFIC